jgi:esterase/lipase superfamily enzyme
MLLFIHGYSNSFDFAVRRAIGFAEDMALEVPVIVFSWPSMNEASGYLYDLGSVTFSRPYVREFLKALSLRRGAERLSVLAHSMGSQVALQVLESSAETGFIPESITFIAPDVPRTLFEQQIALYGKAVKLTTLYANDWDRALFVSTQVNRQAAAGAAGNDLLVIDDVETVDVSEVDRQLLEINHTHGFDVPKVASDVSLLLRTRVNADGRHLPHALRSNRTYWRILP